VLVDVELQERYWYPEDGGEVWVAGYHVLDAAGHFLGRDAPELAALGLLISHVAGAVHRPSALESDGAAPGRPLVLRPEPDNPHDPQAVAVLLESGEPLGYVPREIAPRVASGWSAVVLRERRASPRDPRTGVTMLLARADSIELRVR
jgi:HIRAN domain-containing protein